MGKPIKRDTPRRDQLRKRGGGERAQRRTREEGSKNEFGSQDGQEVPNSRERDRQEDGETGLEAYRREKMNGPWSRTEAGREGFLESQLTSRYVPLIINEHAHEPRPFMTPNHRATHRFRC